MPLIQWTEAMSVGLEELDEDHRMLIRVINQLDANAGGDGRRETLRQCLNSLRRYAEFHFAREEKVLTTVNFPGIGVQQDEHRDFVARIQDVARRFEATEGPAPDVIDRDLLNFLRDWLSHHILIEDMAYRPYVERNADAQETAQGFKAAEVWWSQ